VGPWEEALLSWNGTAMVISHDRWFLNKIATHIMAYEAEAYTRPLLSSTRAVSHTSHPKDPLKTP
jgi:ATPase subunit of ABC transporter with duplicated ATPase domains